jgi:fibro-slime domain-containing protein
MREKGIGSKMKFKLWAILFLLALGNAFAVRIHVKDPWPTATKWQGLKVLGSTISGPPGADMTSEGNGWYYFDLPGNQQPNAGFYIVMYSPAGYDPTQPDYASEQRFHASGIDQSGTDFTFGQILAVGDEVWIVPHGTADPDLLDYFPGTKVVYILNPWPQSAPDVFFGSSTKPILMKQSNDNKRCEWFFYPVTGTDYKVTFKNNIGTQRYGQGGLGATAASIDLTTFFATNDTAFITPTPYPNGSPVIKSGFTPGSGLACTHPLAVTVRDFSAAHPDFEGGMPMGDQVRKGMVASTLDPNTKKPAVGPTPMAGFQTLFNWFTDDSTNATPGNRNYRTCYDLPLRKDKQGYWGYDSYRDAASHSFFPIDNFNRFNETYGSDYPIPGSRNGPDWSYLHDPTNGKHNFHFCMEMHAKFTYETGQKFKFTGDDDMWVYINNKLALDLGGTHQATIDSVKLDSPNLGLSAGNTYDFDMYYCERQTTGSNLVVQTSIYFQQPSVILDKKVLPDGTIQYHVREIQSGGGTCAAPSATSDTVDAVGSQYEISGPGLATPDKITPGVPYGGGVVVIDQNTYIVKIDTTKAWTGRPGTFTVTITTGSGRSSEIKFTIPGSLAAEFQNKREASPPYTGEISAVSIQATLNGGNDTRSDTVQLTFPTALEVYSDSARSQRIQSGGKVVIDADGNIRIYVTSQTPGQYGIDLIEDGTGKKWDSETFTFQKRLNVTLSATPAEGTYPTLPTVTISSNPGGATIYYTDDGTPPDSLGGGTSKKYAGPITLTGTTTIKAIGTMPGYGASTVLTATYTYKPPAVVTKAWYKDMDGDGQIDRAYVEFSKALPVLPSQLAFTIVDQTGKTGSLTASGAALALEAGNMRVAVTFTPPFAAGITSVAPGSKGHTFAQDAIPLEDKDFNVLDSVPPIIVDAVVYEVDETHPVKQIVVTFSEPITAPSLSQTAFIFKRGADLFATADVKVNAIRATNNNEITFDLDSNSARTPISGDFIAINTTGEIKDSPGNSPSIAHFQVMRGALPKAKPTDVKVFFSNEGKDAPDLVGPHYTGSKDRIFVPIGNNGQPLDGSAPVGENKNFVGPVFQLEIPGPVDYEFQIFDNFGEFVAKGKGKIEEKDLALLSGSGSKKYARVVWTGYTSKGNKAATGAYILQSTLRTAVDPKTNAPPAATVKRVVFGLLRQFGG